MNDASKAVFLSYPSQDAEAAHHIAESLRASGVEVWFDVEGGLEHGDEWDAKIRRQIKECVLFIPLISANTQARHEGYFRIEWDLAAERARGIASGVPFILPVVIDDTREPDALVPDRFRAVQWTKLPDGVVPPDVRARFLKLWSHRTGALQHLTRESVGAALRRDDLEESRRKAAPAMKSRRWLVTAMVGVLATAALAVWRPWPRSDSEQPARPELAERASSPDKSVAVLAFADLSDDKNNEYFSDGISEELLNVLAKIHGLKVTARTSAFYFKGKDVPVPEIAQKLGVAYVVEGSVRKQGDRVRISAQLIKASDGFQMWTDQFDRELKDIFAVQDEIAGLVAQQLQLKLGVAKPGRFVNPEAYQLVLKGRHFWTLRGEANLAIAEEAFQRALEIDPNFAEAHAGIADVWMIRAWFRAMADGGPAVAEDLERATTAAQRATELDPGLAEPYATLGAVRHIQGRFAEVEALFARALELNPNYVAALHWHATHAMAMGRFDTSLEELRLASRLDPLAPMPLWALAGNLIYIGAAREAFDVADRALRLRPGFPPLLAVKALAALNSGRRDEALAAARAIAADHSDAPRWWADADAIFILRQSGHLDEAQQLADRVFATVPAVDYRRTLALAALGRMDEALNAGRAFPSTALQPLIASPIWDPAREDPRFHALVEALGISREYREGRATLERMRRQNNAGQ